MTQTKVTLTVLGGLFLCIAAVVLLASAGNENKQPRDLTPNAATTTPAAADKDCCKDGPCCKDGKCKCHEGCTCGDNCKCAETGKKCHDGCTCTPKVKK